MTVSLQDRVVLMNRIRVAKPCPCIDIARFHSSTAVTKMLMPVGKFSPSQKPFFQPGLGCPRLEDFRHGCADGDAFGEMIPVVFDHTTSFNGDYFFSNLRQTGFGTSICFPVAVSKPVW